MNLQNAILPLFSSIIFLAIGIAVFLLSRLDHRKAFLRFCYFTFHWQFSWFLLFYLNNADYADLIVKIGYSGIIFLPIAFYEAICAYLKFDTRYIKIFYGIGIIFLAFLWFSDLFISGAHEYYFGFYPQANYLHIVYMGFVTYSLIRITLNLIRMIKNSDERFKKIQLIFYLAADAIYSMAAIDYALNYPFILKSFNITLYPVGVFFILMSVMVFVLSHFISLNIRLELKVEEKTSQLKKSYEDLKQTEEHKQQFISNIAHDLKTPLSVIAGHAGLLRNSTEITSEKDIRYLGYIIDSVAQTDRLFDALINIALLDSNEDKPRFDLYDYCTLVKHFADRFRFEAKSQKKEFQIILPEQKFIVRSDGIWLERILGNLIKNAFKFTEPHGKIKISVYCDASYIYTEVMDTGCGIDADKIKYIFDRKFQAEGEKKELGYGLGLSIVKEKIELLGGRIEVASKINEGTTFRFMHPLHTDQTSEYRNAQETRNRKFVERRSGNDRRVDKRTEAYIQAIRHGNLTVDIIRYENKSPGKPTILICEDTIGQLHLLIEGLKKHYNLLFAENGIAGLDKLDQFKEQVDLIISDVKMPGMDGIEFCKKVFEQKEYAHIPLIFITAYFNEDDQYIGLRSGATDYLQKPFNETILLEKVNHWISRRRYELLLADLARDNDLKARQISKMKSILIHEINNPMQMIFTARDLLGLLDSAAGIEAHKKEDLKKYLEMLNNGALALKSVMETTRQLDMENIKKQPERIDRLIEGAVLQTAHLTGNINMDLDLNSAGKIRIMAEKKMLSQVFVNIIRNASEAIHEKRPEEDGKLSIWIEKDDKCRIKIKDNGIGMPPEALSRLFEFQFTTKNHGTGVGLHVSRMIIKLHEGNIWAESEPGRGTTFIVELPLAV